MTKIFRYEDCGKEMRSWHKDSEHHRCVSCWEKYSSMKANERRKNGSCDKSG